jgi:hypothetical protein
MRENEKTPETSVCCKKIGKKRTKESEMESGERESTFWASDGAMAVAATAVVSGGAVAGVRLGLDGGWLTATVVAIVAVLALHFSLALLYFVAFSDVPSMCHHFIYFQFLMIIARQ